MPFENLAKYLLSSTNTPTAITTPVDNSGSVLGMIQKHQSSILHGEMPEMGVDAIIQDWVRQQFVYRRSILQDLYMVTYQISECRTCVIQIQHEIFRKGFTSWKAKFVAKCVKCNKEYDHEIDQCRVCYEEEVREIIEYDPITFSHIRKLIKVPKLDKHGHRIHSRTKDPDVTQIQAFDQWAKNVNHFGNNLESVLRQLEDDLNIADDSFLLLNKEYGIDINGNIAHQKLQEIIRLHPALVEFDIDRKDGLPGKLHFICPLHRLEQVVSGPGRCAHCNAILQPATFKYYYRGRYNYYLKDEILHSSKFSPSLTYGYSPVLTLFEKILVVLGQDRTLYRYFYERRTPQGLIITHTDDPQSLKAEIERIRTEMIQRPETLPWVAASARSGRGRTDFVKLAYSFQETDFPILRQTMREAISSIWGVTPIWMSVTSGFGGVSKESAQIEVMDRTIEHDQRIFNEQILPPILETFGVTDWEFRLKPPVEEPETQLYDLYAKKVQLAQMMTNLGFEVTLESGKDINFTYRKKSVGEEEDLLSELLEESDETEEEGEKQGESQSNKENDSLLDELE